MLIELLEPSLEPGTRTLVLKYVHCYFVEMVAWMVLGGKGAGFGLEGQEAVLPGNQRFSCAGSVGLRVGVEYMMRAMGRGDGTCGVTALCPVGTDLDLEAPRCQLYLGDVLCPSQSLRMIPWVSLSL